MESNGLLLAGVVLTGVTVASAASSATETAEGTFVFEFDSFTNPTQTLSLAPFSGNVGDLTGVTLELDSTVNVTDSDSGESSLSVSLGFTLIDINVSVESLTPGSYDFSKDLLALGINKSEFIGGPVDFTLRAFADEGSMAGTWFAGEDPDGGGFSSGIDLGGATLTYTFDEDFSSVPLPGGLPLLLGAGAALAGLSRRRRRLR